MKKFLAAALTICLLIASVLPPVAAQAADTPDVTVLDVSDYGVLPGDADNAEAIQEVMEEAKRIVGPVVISFPKGEYQFYPDRAYHRELYISNTVGADPNYKIKNIGFLFEDMEDITVEGNGSMFMFHGRMMAFSTINCKNITFQNLSFDYKVPSVVDITVESVDEKGRSAMIAVPQCYNYEIDGTRITWKSDVSPYTGETYWTASDALANVANQIYDAKTGLTVRSSTPLFNGLSGIEDLGDHRLRFTYGSSLPGNVKEGYSYQMRDTVRDHSAMFFWKSEGITLRDVNAHFLYGFGVVGQNSADITLDGVKFDVPKNSGRTTAGFADFVQMSGCKGEIRVENCLFSNPHDDPINIHGTFLKVVRKSNDNKTFKVRFMHNETAGFPNFFEGDEVEFMTAGNMIPVEDSVATVVSVKGPTGDAGASESGTGSLTDIEITLDRALPQIQANTHVVENITYTPSAVIKNNTFRQVPTRGILVTTRKKVEIQDNLFDGMGMASIYISNDAQGWYESGPVRDVTIEGNTFLRPAAGAAAIFIEPTNPLVSTDQTVHENIAIQNNVFFMQNGQVLNAKSTKGLSFRNNEIYRYQPDVKLSLSASSESLRAGNSIRLAAEGTGRVMSSDLYAFNGCKNVTLDGNYYDGGLKLNAVTKNMSADEVTVGAAEGVVVNGSANVLPAVKGIRYESSDERILKIDTDGTATGLAPGTVTVKAYIPSGEEKISSNEIPITVTEGVTPENNAFLASIGTGRDLLLDGPFDSDNLYYTGVAGRNEVSIQLKAEQKDARIEAVLDGKSAGTGIGSLDVSLLFHGGKNLLHVLVTSANGVKDNVYTFEIGGLGSRPVYLSDIPYDEEQSESGYGEVVVKDRSTDGSPIRLLDADGSVKTFEKGLGSHASTTLVYHLDTIEGLADSGVTFSAYVGIDQEITKRQEPDVRFRIYGDGALLHETDVMYADTPMEWISVDVSGVRELKLVADELEHNWSDHVDFADAKLTCVQQGEDETYVVRYRAVPKAGGSVSASTSETKTSNGFIGVSKADEAVLAASAKTGYAFAGWYGEDGKLCTLDTVWTVRGFTQAGLYTARFTAANRPQLEAAVHAAAQKNLSGYTAESAAVFKTAILNAQKLLEKEEASPAEIGAALEALTKAEAGLSQIQTPVPKPPENGGGSQKPITVPAEGTTFEAGGFRYQVTKSHAKKGTVSLIKVTGKKKAKLTVPATVKKDGFTFSVTKIGKNACKKNEKLTSVTIGKHITSIGSNAFNGCKKLKTVTFKCTKAPKMGAKAWKGISAKCKITIPKKMPSAQRKLLKRRMSKEGVGKKAVYQAK